MFQVRSINTGMAIFCFGCSTSSSSSLLSTLKIVTRQQVGRSTVTLTWQNLVVVCKKYFFTRKVFSTNLQVLIFWHGTRRPQDPGPEFSFHEPLELTSMDNLWSCNSKSMTNPWPCWQCRPKTQKTHPKGGCVEPTFTRARNPWAIHDHADDADQKHKFEICFGRRTELTCCGGKIWMKLVADTTICSEIEKYLSNACGVVGA